MQESGRTDEAAQMGRRTFDVVSGMENHLWLVSASDMNGDPDRFETELDAFLEEAEARPARTDETLIGYIGVPSVFSDLYDFLESLGARVVFNEMQRQFAMPPFTGDLLDQYQRYTYPYRVWGRIEDIRRAVSERKLSGIIHYVQSFCFRGIQDRLVRSRLDVPILTLECDRPGVLDARSRTRIEAFMEMIAQ